MLDGDVAVGGEVALECVATAYLCAVVLPAGVCGIFLNAVTLTV